MKKIFWSIIGVLILSSCSNNDELETHISHQPINLSEGQTRVAESNNNLAYNLLDEGIKAAKEDENLFQCPLGAAVSLGMLVNGAEGETMTEIMRFLGDVNVEDYNSFYRLMADRLPGMDDRVVFALANSLWIDSRLSVKEQYKNILKDSFDADIYPCSLGTYETMERINGWCSGKTRGLIPRFLQSPVEGTFALFNAVYFNGRWKCPFPKDKTRDCLFSIGRDNNINVPMMHLDRYETSYIEGEGWEALQLPYGNESFRMEIMLPAKDSSVEDVMQILLNSGQWSENEWEEVYATVNLPKFKISQKSELVPLLQGLGLKSVFSGEADFKGISGSSFNVDRMVQESFIEVNEEGTVATSVTHIDGWAASKMPRPINFFVNRPFIFFIKEKSTGAIIFSGVIRRP